MVWAKTTQHIVLQGFGALFLVLEFGWQMHSILISELKIRGVSGGGFLKFKCLLILNSLIVIPLDNLII